MKTLILGLFLSFATIPVIAAENPYLTALYKAINDYSDMRFDQEAQSYEETGSGCRYYSRGPVKEFNEVAPGIFKATVVFTCRDEDGLVTAEPVEELVLICNKDASACSTH